MLSGASYISLLVISFFITASDTVYGNFIQNLLQISVQGKQAQVQTVLHTLGLSSRGKLIY